MEYVVGLALVATVGAAAQLVSLPSADLAYLLYAAGRVLEGARLYVDVVEVNPPLIVVLNLPAVLLSRAAGLSDIVVYRLLTGAVLLGSLAFTDYALRRCLGAKSAPLRRALVLVLACTLFLAPGGDFGQREHLLAALTLPYLMLAAGRGSGRAASGGTAFAAGVLAAVGLALKPQFLLVWVAVEVYVGRRNGLRRPAPEIAGAATFLALYLVGVLLFAPEYIDLVRLLGPAYAGFGHYPLPEVLGTAPGAALCAMALLAWLVLRGRAEHAKVAGVLLVAMLAAFLAAALQQKGWGYHFYPARAFALALLALVVLDGRKQVYRPVEQVYTAAAVAALGTTLLLAFVGAARRLWWRDAAARTRLAQSVEVVRRYMPPGGSVYVMSFTNESAFPLVNYSGVRLASRFPHLWILEAAYRDRLREPPPLRYRPAADMGPAERYLNQAVYEDLTRHRPDLLMVLRHARDLPRNAHRRLDYLAYFARDPRIAAALAHYRPIGEAGEYLLFARDGGGTDATVPRLPPGELDVEGSGPRRARDALLGDREFLLAVVSFIVLAVPAYLRERRAGQREPRVRQGPA